MMGLGGVSAGSTGHCARSENPRRHPLGGVALHGWRDVGVDLPRHVGARVVEALGDDLDVDAFVEGEGRPSVTQTVKDQSGEWFLGV